MGLVSEPTFAQFAMIMAEKIGIPLEDVTPDTTLKEIEVDSLALIEVALVAEENFGGEIPTDDLSSAITVQDLYEFVATAIRVGG
jgi:acyl carrier protein